MSMIKKAFWYVFLFFDKLQKAHIGAYASQAAYYLMLSGIPLLMLLLTLIQYTSLTESALLGFLSDILPSVIMPFVTRLMAEVYTKSGTVLSVSAIVLAWSAARGVLAITSGFNNIYGLKETRNYFVLRFHATWQTVLFLVALIFSMLLFVFSEQSLEFLSATFPVIELLLEFFANIRFALVIMVELLVFMFIYKFLPNRKGHLAWQIPGALFAAVTWSSFSSLFSIYIGNFSNMSYIYGSLTTVIIFMLWIYFCMYILLIGAGINACIERYPRWRKWERFRRAKSKNQAKRK